MPRNDRESSRKWLRLTLSSFGINDANDIVERFSHDMDSLDLFRIEELAKKIWEKAEQDKEEAAKAKQKDKEEAAKAKQKEIEVARSTATMLARIEIAQEIEIVENALLELRKKLMNMDTWIENLPRIVVAE